MLDEHGSLDIMVCAVGGTASRLSPDSDGAFFDRTIRLNLSSVFKCARAASEPMLAQNDGSALFFSAKVSGLPGQSAYGAAKAAAESFMRTIVVELADTRVSVNAIMPGMTDTPLLRRAYDAVEGVTSFWLRSGTTTGTGSTRPRTW